MCPFIERMRLTHLSTSPGAETSQCRAKLSPPPESKAEEDYISRKKALYRKIIDACDECGMSTAGVVSVLREVTDRINICRNSRPMQDIMADMKKSRFYQD